MSSENIQAARTGGHKPEVESNERIERESARPRADGGWEAWGVLCGCFCLEAFVWGFPCSFDMFEQHQGASDVPDAGHPAYCPLPSRSIAADMPPELRYPQSPVVTTSLVLHESFDTHGISSSELTGSLAIGALAIGFMYLGTPFMVWTLQRWPHRNRLSMITGVGVVTAALLASSFASNIWHLILTQGILYGLGGILTHTPTLFYLDEWWVRRKGLAIGLMGAGTGAGGVAIPLVLKVGLETFEYRTIVRIWAVFFDPQHFGHM
ncbi:MAG: hypothetical protein M1837_001911 [Sclerophora amabilis]|nr:MAG: hypothetical protein M1837_001911 [Sclerophora amabilis]